MDFAIELATTADSWKVAKRAEELGLHAAWFEDSQMVAADPFVAMGLGAISVETLGRHLRAVRGLLARDTVNWDFGSGRARV